MKRRQFLAGLGGIIAARRSFYFGGQDVVTVRQPYLQNVRTDRATVMWATQTPGNKGVVQYTSDGITFNQASAVGTTFATNQTSMSNPFTQYTAELSGLAPNTTYHYYCAIDGESVATISQFKTAGPGPFKFLAMGDSGMGTGAADGGLGQARIATLLAAEQASMLLHVGDIAYFNGNYPAFQQNYFNYYFNTMSRMPVFPTPGNHEYDMTGAVPYFAMHSLPTETVPAAELGQYYSFDWGNVHFVSLDSNGINYQTGAPIGALGRAIQGTGNMLTWLDQDLKATQQYWKVVFFHHPPYAGGRNLGDPNEGDVRNYIVPILEANGVQLALNGHEHSYQRTYSIRESLIVPDGAGTVYMTLGGGGADLYNSPGSDLTTLHQTAVKLLSKHFMLAEVNGTNLTMTIVADSGAQLEKISISPQPVLSDEEPPEAITFDPGPHAGALIKIRGRNLADQEVSSGSSMAPTLAGTSLTVAGRIIPLGYVSPTQIIGRIPFAVGSSFPFKITTTNGTLSEIGNSTPVRHPVSGTGSHRVPRTIPR